MSGLTKSLDEMIKEKKTGRSAGKGGRGGGAKGGKGAAAAKPAGGKGAKGASGGGRQAGAKRGVASFAGASQVTAARARPFQSVAVGGRGGGGKGAKGGARATPVQQPRNKVFISGLPFDWEEHDILHVLETCGAVEKLTIFWDQQGRPTGNAVAAYERDQSAKQALNELDGAKLGDKVIGVKMARPDKVAAPAGKQVGGRGNAAVARPSTGKGANGKGAKGQKAQKEFGKKQKQPAGKGAKGAKGAKGSKKGAAPKSKAKVERKEVASKDDLDAQLDAYLKKD